MNELHQSEWLSVKDVAGLLGCSTRTVWSLRAGGHIPAPVKVGPGLVRWRRATLNAWLAELESTNFKHKSK